MRSVRIGYEKWAGRGKNMFIKAGKPKISYRSGQHKTELDLLLVRRKQMWRVNDCKIIAGEHVATQQKPLVFVVRMQKSRKEKVMMRKTIKLWKCYGYIAIVYKERLTLDYEKCETEVGTLKEGWKSFK